MRVRDILRYKGTALLTVTPQAPLSSCVSAMADEDLGSAVVLDGTRLVGVVTFREVNRALDAGTRDPSPGADARARHLRVADVMVRAPLVAGTETELDALRAGMLQARQRYVPVLDGDVLAGVLSFHDVARALHEARNVSRGEAEACSDQWPETAAAALDGGRARGPG